MRLFAFLLLLGVTGCPAAPPPTEHARHDRLTCPAGGDDFQAPVKAAIQKFLAGVDPASKPVAVFDWDNTMIKNDIGAATLFHMVREGLVMRPHSWDEFSDLTDAARSRLSQACAGGGKFLPSREKPGCGSWRGL